MARAAALLLPLALAIPVLLLRQAILRLEFWARASRAVALVQAPGAGAPERLAELASMLAALEGSHRDDPLLAALGLGLALAQGNTAESSARLDRLAAGNGPLSRSLAWYRAQREGPPPEPAGQSDPLALLFDGWRLAHRGTSPALGEVLERFPAALREEPTVAWLDLIQAVGQRPRDATGIAARLDALLKASQRPTRLPHLGFGPDAFEPRLTRAADGGLAIESGPWKGELVPMREAQRRRLPDLHYGLAVAHSAAGQLYRSMTHAQLLEEHFPQEVQARGLGPRLEPLLFPRGFQEHVEAAARAEGLDPHLVYAVIREESHFRPEAVSGAGALGLMQLMPSTAQWIERERGRRDSGAPSLHDPAVNLALGAWYLRYLAEKFGDKETRWRWAMAAYNAGLKPTTAWLARWKAKGRPADILEIIDFTETRNYVKKVDASWQAYRRLYATTTP